MSPNIEIFKNILLFILLPITIISILIILFTKIKKKKDKKIIYLTSILLFVIYFLFVLALSIYELIELKKYTYIPNHRLLTFLWIILPLIPLVCITILYKFYKKERGENNGKVKTRT